MQNGQRETRRFTGAGLRGGLYVLSSQDNGNGLRLDGGWFGVTLVCHCAQQLGR